MSGTEYNQEIELKLRLPAPAARCLAAHPLLCDGGEPATRRLYTVYYDTPERKLARGGVALRLRRDGERWIQALKGAGAAAGGLHQRVEIERELPDQIIDFDAIRASPWASLFTARLRARLRPVFATRFVRSERRIAPAPGLVIDAAIDRGEIVSGEAVEPLCELELELRSGDPAALYQFALELARTVPLAIENRSKAERGYALAAGAGARPVRSRAVALDAGMTVATAFRHVAGAALDHLQANSEGTLAGTDPEYLHQMRVALRRMRSVFRVFAPAFAQNAMRPLIAEMRWLADALGPARDWDVFVEETLPRFSRRIRGRSARTALDTAAGALRARSNGAARRAVGSPRYRLFTLSLAGWLAAEAWVREPGSAGLALARPVLSFASETLAARYGKARKRGRRLASRSAPELHRLRIAIKKLRYAGDFFSSLYDERRARRMLRRLSRLQDILGEMNDAAQSARQLDQCCARMPKAACTEARRALADWAQAGAAPLKRRLKRGWAAFRQLETFW